MLAPLPIDTSIERILSSFRTHKNLILQASPGSGKTTRVPPAILKSNIVQSHLQIVVLEPRRIAAKLAALRVAEEHGTAIGETIGYHFRLEKKTSSKNRITFLTEGMLMRYTLSDPSLKNVGVIILDEFHERHLHSDLAISYLVHLQKTSRPDLKILVMSATLDTTQLTSFLPDAPVIDIEAPRFPVDIRYDDCGGKRLEEKMAFVIAQLIKESKAPGHVLAFLPGMKEIRNTHSNLQGIVSCLVYILHGDLSKEEQEAALQPSKTVKVILTTNIAESSVTIDGVNTVVDSGLERVGSVSPWTGLSALHTKPVSKASAIQRAGRAGRQGPGICVRLFSQGEFDSRPAFGVPEIRRSDLTQSLLELSVLGVHSEHGFKWFETPDLNQIKASEELLKELGAIHLGIVTETGKRLASLPLHPRLGKLLLEAEKEGCLKAACRLAALISEGDLRDLDVERSLHASPGFSVRKTEEKLLGFFQSTTNSQGGLALCVLRAFPDRVARIRPEKKQGKFRELVIANGGTCLAEENPFTCSATFFVVLHAQESKALGAGKTALYAKALIAIEETWLLDLPDGLLQETVRLSWDAKLKCVCAETALSYGQLVLDSKQTPAAPSIEALDVFLREVLKARSQDLDWYGLLDALAKVAPKETLEDALFRVLYLAQERRWPVPKPYEVLQALLPYFTHRISLSEIETLDWEAFLKSAIANDKANHVDRLCPAYFELHKKRRAKIHYSLDKAPWIESRLQDFFGVRDNPAVLEGAVPLVLHLLAPNQRAVQVTQDLKGFWTRHYPEIRKELSRRYPRHKWPIDPMVPESK